MSALYDPPLDTFLETEEFISAEEFLRRRERGEINPSDVRYISHIPGGPEFGGFMVKLKQPRYRVAVSGNQNVGALYE